MEKAVFSDGRSQTSTAGLVHLRPNRHLWSCLFPKASLWLIGPTASALEHVEDARDHTTIIHVPCAGLIEFGP